MDYLVCIYCYSSRTAVQNEGVISAFIFACASLFPELLHRRTTTAILPSNGSGKSKTTLTSFGTLATLGKEFSYVVAKVVDAACLLHILS